MAILFSVITLRAAHVPFANAFYLPQHAVGIIDGEMRYERGPLDILFIFFYVLQLTCLRALLMRLCLRPLGKWMGVPSVFKQIRFAEQGYVVIYNLFSWPFGVV